MGYICVAPKIKVPRTIARDLRTPFIGFLLFRYFLGAFASSAGAFVAGAFVAGAFASAGASPLMGGADLTSSRDLRSVTPPGSVLAAFAASSSCDCIPPSACFSSPEHPIATSSSAAMSSD